MDSAVEMIGVGEGLMGKEIAFQIAPGPLNVVQLGGVFRQPFDRQPGPRSKRERGELAGMNGTVVQNEDDGLVGTARTGSVHCLQPSQKIDEIAAALGCAGAGDQPMSGKVEGAEHGSFLCLPRRFDAQITAAFRPGPSEIGMCERFRLIAEQQRDIAGFGLLLQQTKAQAGAVNGIAVLPALQRVAGPTPGEAPFFSTTLSRDLEMRSPVRFSISSAKRGSVQFGRSDIPGVNNSSITDRAARAFLGSGPSALRARSPDTPSRPKIHRQCRTLSGCTQNAA